MAYFAPIHPIRVTPPNFDVSPIAEGFEAILKRRTAQQVGDRLSGNDLRGATTAAFGGGDVKTGLALRQLESQEAQRAAGAARAATADREARDEKARTYVRNMLASEDPDAPDFAERWAGHLRRLRASGYPVGSEYDDPKAGYQLALTEALGPRGVIELRNRRAQRPGMEGLELNEEGELEVRAAPQGGPRGLANPAAFRPPDPRAQADRELSPTPVQTQVPGVTMEPSRGRETREQFRRRTAEELGPAVTGQSAAPTETQIQQYWASVYGRSPRAGFRYDRRGREVANTEGDTDRNTRAGIKGALESASDNINDAREVLRGTNMVQRGLSYMTDVGVAARVDGPIRIAIRGILHGISGAAINIPEQQEYFAAMRPGTGDTINTIEFKLNHLENILTHIRRVQGTATDEQVLAVRNAMRKTLGLSELTLQQSRQRLDQRTPGGRQPRAGSRPPAGQTMGGDDGFSIRKLD